MRDGIRVALLSEVFHDEEGPRRLAGRLAAAARLAADLVLLPELPLDGWCPATRVPTDEDSEPPGGPRQAAQAAAARAAGVALLGGAIVRDPATGRRHNTAVLFDGAGQVAARYRKLHLPSEEGFWESHHYEAGDQLPAPVPVLGFPVGIQICSDVNRPEVAHVLGAMGALALLVPRATPPETWARWRTVLRSTAVTAGLYVLSVNRPGPEPGTSIGGPSLAVGPDGEVLSEAEGPEPMVVELERAVVLAARQAYPGYLPVRSDLYATGWAQAAGNRAPAAFPRGERDG